MNSLLEENSSSTHPASTVKSKISTNNKPQLLKLTVTCISLGSMQGTESRHAIDYSFLRFAQKGTPYIRILIHKSTEKNDEARGIHNSNQAQPYQNPT
jgi:hypothetical protein